MIVLDTGDLTSAQTAGAGDLDTQGAGPHGTAHGVLHGTAVADTALQLLGDVLSHQLGGGIHALDLNDVEGHALADHLLHLKADTLDLGAALADDHAGLGAVEVDADLGVVTLDLDLGDAGGIESLLQILTDLEVLHQQIAHLLVLGVPAGIPVLDDADPEAMRIYFLSHITWPPFLPQRR